MADLATIRTIVKRWAPGVAALAIGATLTTLGVRALASLGASKSDLVIMVAGVVAVASANAFWWWYRGRHQAAALREARQIGNAWHAWATHYGRRVDELQEANARLVVENEQLSRREVIEVLHERMGDKP